MNDNYRVRLTILCLVKQASNKHIGMSATHATANLNQLLRIHVSGKASQKDETLLTQIFARVGATYNSK